MSAIPSILSSAQSLFTTGFSSLNRAATQAAAPEDSTPTTPGQDPLLGSAVDVTSAREDVSAATILMHTSNQMTRDLMRTVDRYNPTDHYA